MMSTRKRAKGKKLTTVKMFNILWKEIKSVRSDLAQEIKNVRTDLTHEIKNVRTDLSQEIHSVRVELGQEAKSIRLDLRKENKKMLDIAMQETADVYRELQQDMQLLHHRLARQIDTVIIEVKSLTEKVDTIQGDVKAVKLNQETFIFNHEALERRVTLLQTAA